jgi:hypothetical protein
MKANEFRIFNLVYLCKNGIEKEYSIDSGFDLYKLDESDCNDIKPIPLTDEWLLKFGFIFESEDEGYLDLSNENRIFINLYNQENRTYLENDLGDIIDLPKIEYVHTLQNLYFALTGEELILQENLNTK